MGRIISRHLEELATPRISEWGAPFLLEEARLVEGASQDGQPCWWSEDAMLAERRNSKASSDLPKKIGTEKGEKKERPEGGRGFFFRVFSKGAEVGVLQLIENQAVLLQGRHSGLIISHLRFFTFTVIFYSFLMFGMLIFYCLRR